MTAKGKGGCTKGKKKAQDNNSANDDTDITTIAFSMSIISLSMITQSVNRSIVITIIITPLPSSS